MKRMALSIAAALLAAATPLIAVDAAEEAEAAPGRDDRGGIFSDDKLSIYGYVVDYVGAELKDSDTSPTALGNIIYLRMKGDFRPQEGLLFHAEGVYDARTGNQNSFVLAREYGLAASESDSYVQKLEIDHAWGSAVLGDFSLQFGKIPIGWGSAYVFNPTQRASRSRLLDSVIDETSGVLAVAPSWSPLDALRLSGYAAFQDKSLRDEVDLRDGAWENLPFGLRAQTTVGKFDIAASFIKEVEYLEDALTGVADYRRSSLAGLDCAGAIWDFGVYAEAVIRLPTDDRGRGWEPDGFDLEEALEVAVGFDYSFTALDDLELRVEYYHQGSGESDSDSYNVLSVLSGERLVQAEDYLYCRLEKVFADYFTLDLGCLVNMNDGSAVAFPELSYEARDNLKFVIGADIPWGAKGSEFDGRYDLSALGLGKIDIMQAQAYASCKLSF
jgi:hypothetical protein